MKRVIVIGAGPAGITAAYELSKKGGFEITVLEATDRIGGISQTVKYNGNRMDIGGHRFFSKDSRVTDWWQELLPLQGAPSKDDIAFDRKKDFAEIGPDPEKCDEVMLLRDRISRIYYKNHFFDYPVTLKWDTIKNMGFVTTVKAGFSYLGAKIHKRPEDSLENFYINRFGKVLYSMFFEGYTEKLWGRHPSEISADWGAQRVKGLSITAVIRDMFRKIFGKSKKATETSLIESFSYPKFGPGQLWELALSKAKENGVKVQMNCQVTDFEVADGQIKAVIYNDGNGESQTLKCDTVISTMPINELVNGLGDNVPENVKVAAKGLPFRDFMTVGLLLKKTNLKNKTDYKTLGDIVPDCWIYVQDTSVKLGRIQVFNNWSPYLVSDPEHTVWVGLEYFCREGDGLWSMTEEDAIEFAVSELVKMGIIDRDDVLDSHRELIKKAYPAYFDTYSEMDSIISHLNTYENLFCIGRNGQHRYNNMDLSMATAFEAVNSIVNGTNDKTNIWNVNTEKEYHVENK